MDPEGMVGETMCEHEGRLRAGSFARRRELMAFALKIAAMVEESGIRDRELCLLRSMVEDLVAK